MCIKKGWVSRSNRIGLFFSVLFLVCFIWYFIHPVQQQLHMQLFQLSYYGFDGMNLKSFIFAILQSYVWGYIAVTLWDITCCAKRIAKTKE